MCKLYYRENKGRHWEWKEGGSVIRWRYDTMEVVRYRSFGSQRWL